MQIISQLLVNTLWFSVARLCEIKVSFGQMLYINCQGAVIDSITPGVKFGGEVTRAIQISRIVRCSGEKAAAIVAIQKLFSLSSLFFIQLFAARYLIRQTEFLWILHLQTIVFCVMGLFSMMFIAIFAIPHRIGKYLRKRNPRFFWTRKANSYFITLLDQVGEIRKNTKALARLALLAVLIWLIYPIKMYILAIQFYPGVNLIYIAAITFIAYMVAMIPIFPGGLGGFEGTMVALLIAIGFIISDAAVITVLFRFISFWIVMLLSLILIIYCKGWNICKKRLR